MLGHSNSCWRLTCGRGSDSRNSGLTKGPAGAPNFWSMNLEYLAKNFTLKSGTSRGFTLCLTTCPPRWQNFWLILGLRYYECGLTSSSGTKGFASTFKLKPGWDSDSFLTSGVCYVDIYEKIIMVYTLGVLVSLLAGVDRWGHEYRASSPLQARNRRPDHTQKKKELRGTAEGRL